MSGVFTRYLMMIGMVWLCASQAYAVGVDVFKPAGSGPNPPPPTPDERYRSAVSKGEQSLERKQFGQAIRQLEQAVKLKPKDGRAATLLETARQLLSRQEKELAAVQGIKKVDRLVEAGRYDDAVVLLQQLRNGGADDAQLVERINQLVKLADEARVAREYKDAMDRAEAFFAASKYAPAKLEFEAVLRLKPEDTHARERMTAADEYLKREELEQKYLAAVNAAESLFAAASYVDARKQYDTALSLKPDQAWLSAKINLCVEKIKEREYYDLMQAAQKAIDEKRLVDAEKLIRQGLEVKPGAFDATNLLSRVLDMQCLGVDEPTATEWSQAIAANNTKHTLLLGRSFTDCTGCPEMVVIPAGKRPFTAVTQQGESCTREVFHRKPLAISRFEVTFAQWDQCVREGGCDDLKYNDGGWGRGPQPLVFVSWNDTQTFLSWLSRKTQKKYRLLSEVEWEYMASAGTVLKFPWGGEVGFNHANCKGCGSKFDNIQPAPAGALAANSFGLHETAGNVWEWVADCGHADMRKLPLDGMAWMTECEAKNTRVLKGGAWSDSPESLHIGARRQVNPVTQRDNYGFRIAVDVE